MPIRGEKIDMFGRTFTSSAPLLCKAGPEGAALRLAIVADDLTGALDVSAPLAARGLRVVVATVPAAAAQAIDSGAEVVVVNTASREGRPEDAGEIVGSVSRQLAARQPEWALKKIDSRLKGHVAIEVAAMMHAFGRSRAIVAPAVPSQGRIVRDGHVIGHGVGAPIAIAGAMGALPYEAPDTADAMAFAELLRGATTDTLLVGASGLGVGLGQLLGGRPAPAAPDIDGPLLVVVGSHDPITLQQVEVALAGAAVNHIVSADGTLGSPPSGPALVQAVVPRDGNFAAAMQRFGRSIAELLRDGDYRSVLLSGGETAQTVLGALDIGCLEVLGEVLPGIAVTRASLGERRLAVLTKSGGFGTPQDILRLINMSKNAIPVTDYALAGEQ